MKLTTLTALVLMLLTPFFAGANVLQTANDDVRILGPELDPTKSYTAVLETSLGVITLELFPKEAPLTVRNFVNLIEGTKPWKDPKTGNTEQKPYYDGVVFHRVIKGFMIQGGDPMGTGSGGPGYRFANEIDRNLSFDSIPYALAMANTPQPSTNGSQFFITDKGSFPSHLNGKHTIFGKVISGQDVVDAIAASPKSNPPVITKAKVITAPLISKAVEEPKEAAEEKTKEAKSELKTIKEEMKSIEKESKKTIPASAPTSKPATKPVY
ncbi:MAG: peptidylprolyl isomerase [Sumerlaeia bacterium]